MIQPGGKPSVGGILGPEIDIAIAIGPQDKV